MHRINLQKQYALGIEKMECILFCILLRLIISPKYFKNFSASDALCLAIAVFGVAMQCSKKVL